jgi:putative redox protein
MATIVDADIGRQHYQVRLTAGKNTVVGDEGTGSGGKDEGFNPFQLFLSSLGACTCATLRMYADKKGMNLEKIHVYLSMTRDDEKNVTNITRGIELTGNLSDEQKKRLLEIADKCPTHKLMTHPIFIETQIQESKT